MRSPLLDHDRFVRLVRSRDFLAAHSSGRILIPQAAKIAGISPWHFTRLYTRAFGETPHEFMSRRRLEHAQRLLRGGSLSVTEVCFEVGYEGPGSFSSSFHRFAGVSPRDYRRLWSFPGAALLFSVPHCFSAFWI
ncbi:MAG TPA: AraC family transcriptional regulator [Bryobacteraceae bacterium]|nr:AraC family transcriptional regulator [Bryobacteraceae bacterium]